MNGTTMSVKDLSVTQQILGVVTVVCSSIAIGVAIWSMTSVERTVGLVGELCAGLALSGAVGVLALQRRQSQSK